MESLIAFKLKIITCIVTASQKHHDPFLLIKIMALLSVTGQLRLSGVAHLENWGKTCGNANSYRWT